MRRKDIKTGARDEAREAGMYNTKTQNTNVRKQQQDKTRMQNRVKQVHDEDGVNEMVLGELVQIQNGLPAEKAHLVNEILAEGEHGHAFVNFLLTALPAPQPVAAADSLITLTTLGRDASPSRAELVAGMNQIFEELPKLAAARHWSASDLEAVKSLVASGLFGQQNEKKSMSKELEEYLRTHGIIQLHADRELGKVCTFHGTAVEDVPDATGLLNVFGTISLPDEAARTVNCFNALKLEAFVLSEIQTLFGQNAPSLQGALAAYHAGTLLATASASPPALLVKNPANGRYFSMGELTHIANWADKVRVLTAAVDGTGPFKVTAADLEALVSMRDFLGAADSAKQPAASRTVWSRVKDAYNAGLQHFSTLLNNLGIVWIIRQILCVIARMLAMSIYITKIGAETGVVLLATYIRQNMSQEVKQSIMAGLAGAAPAAPPAENSWSFLSMILVAAAKVGQTLTGMFGSADELPEEVYLKIARSLLIGSLAAATGGWMGLLKSVIASYGTFLIGKTLSVTIAGLYSIWQGGAMLDRAVSIFDRLGFNSGPVAYFMKSIQCIYSVLAPLTKKIITARPLLAGSVVVAASFAHFIPAFAPALIAYFGSQALLSGLYTVVTGYFSFEIFSKVLSTTMDLFSNPLLAKVSTIETYLMMSSPGFLCSFFTAEQTRRRKVCDTAGTFLVRFLQTGKVFSLLVQSMSDVWYIQHILRTGAEPTTVFGFPWKPSRCLAEWTHGPERGQVLTGLLHENVLESLATKPGVRGAMVAEYIPDFIKSYAADQLSDPLKSASILEALKSGGRRKSSKKTQSTLRRTTKLSRSSQRSSSTKRRKPVRAR